MGRNLLLLILVANTLNFGEVGSSNYEPVGRTKQCNLSEELRETVKYYFVELSHRGVPSPLQTIPGVMDQFRKVVFDSFPKARPVQPG